MQPRKKRGSLTLIQCSIEAYANLVAPFKHLFVLFLSLTQRTRMLELQETLLTPNLARYSRIHACELTKKMILTCSGQKVPYSCMRSSTRLTNSENWTAWPGSESITLQIRPQQFARFELRSQHTFARCHTWQQPCSMSFAYQPVTQNKLVPRLLGMYYINFLLKYNSSSPRLTNSLTLAPQCHVFI